MENQEINKKIIETLAVLICNRPIVYENNSKFQTETAIMASNYIVGLHEICHWIAAIPSERGKYNLDLPLNAKAYDASSIERRDRMDKEECIALSMPILFYQKYLAEDEELKSKLLRSAELPDELHYDVTILDAAKASVNLLFEEYTQDLDRETLLYVALN
jgi:hypothetical protein